MADDGFPKQDDSLAETIDKFPDDLQTLVPPENLPVLERTNQMHCGPEETGGSKFEGVGNILEIVAQDATRIIEGIHSRLDDRDVLMAAGASPDAFLPSSKAGDAPEGLPEALYFKVEGIPGSLRVAPLQDLDPSTPIVVMREKSRKDENGVEQVPASFTAFLGKEEFPQTDFATVIVGRNGGESGQNQLWTVHPGAPIRPATGDFFEGSDKLVPPVEGEPTPIIVKTIAELIESGQMTPESHVKLSSGDLQRGLEQGQYRQL